MRGKSHLQMGAYLAQQYLQDAPQCCVRAFLIGCIEPDRNPLSYLKGSLHRQWLRGHNYENAKRYMYRIAHRLEKKSRWTLLDYYTMGKLIHYTTDSFTYAHNENFSTALSDHKHYEDLLQTYFLRFIRENPQVNTKSFCSVREVIRTYHRDYSQRESSIGTDTHFALHACCSVLAVLLSGRMI